MPKYIIFAFTALVCFSRLLTAEDTQFHPGATWQDSDGVPINAHGGGILFHEGVYYWFGEHKVATKIGNTAQVGVSCYSSTDLYHWKNEGIVLPVSEVPGHDLEKGCILERPKVIYNRTTHQFVMWFHLELKGQGYRSARSGVAVADKATGPYHYIESFRPDGQMARDMTLFVDEDGKAYHLYASEDNKTLHISLLSDDYLKPSGKFVRVFEKRSMEAPSICKRDGKYFFIGSDCTGWKPNLARSAVADNIFGPWKELGNPTVGKNPHTGLDEKKTFGGQSTHILKVEGKPDAYIAMFDVWTPDNPIDGQHIWLPINFENGEMKIKWADAWDLSAFQK